MRSKNLLDLTSLNKVLGTPNEDTWPGVHSLPHFKPERFTVYSSKSLRQAWNKLSYVNHAEDLASKLLQCSPKNRLSAQAALSHEYFSDLPPRLWELTDITLHKSNQASRFTRCFVGTGDPMPSEIFTSGLH
ncbi:cyclin-dependent kinase 14 [Cricetulus griseus]|nr:cyclin-dependent kinase 14 [Cricetulus griseus]